MKVIDLLNKIVNGEDVPKKVKVDKDIYTYYPDKTFIERYKTDRDEYLCNIYLLKEDVEIIEDKLINPIAVFTDDNGYSYYLYNEYGTKCSLSTHDKVIVDKINEIIDKVNGDKNE